MTSESVPPARPATPDEMPTRLAIPALALGAFGLGTNEFAAMGLPDIASGIFTSASRWQGT
jgi:MFS transporter, DHA1 family, inner membrane transport protein